MSLAKVAKQLDWYSEDEILNPSGYGAKVYAELVKKKIERTLKFEKNIDVNVGVLVNDPTSNETQLPIAIVCEFQIEIDVETLNLTHKLSWNFCRSPLLIIIEPQQVRALSCYIKPEESESTNTEQLPFGKTPNQDLKHKAEIIQFPIGNTHSAHKAAESLRWIDLYSGQFLRNNEKTYFSTRQRVDFMLLENLKFIRQELIKLNLDEDIVHDLLARLIFVQFLFQRKDSDGNSAINEEFLKDRHTDKTLSRPHRKLEEILSNKIDTYNFFRWLNNKFNGDLFPGRGETEEERETEWKQEMDKVEQKHLNLLADFISGNVKMKMKQPNFWKFYSFDVIPLEFISSIYEEFVTKDTGVHYTPSHIVDFILDNKNVLPWNEKKWDLKILDPACGSGIFLVKAFQRLVQRWKNANPEKPIDADSYRVLTDLLKNNLFGTDTNPHAVRVAAFSLYLAMCDEIDPKHYLQNWQFPPMRDKQIVTKDFFEEYPLFPHRTEKIEYDLVIGNAPWGKSSIDKSEPAKNWAKAKENNWEVPYKDIGPLFLPKSILATKDNCVVAMMQPVNSLLFNESGAIFRQKLFTEYKIEEIANISALRFHSFSDAISPFCIVILRHTKPDGQPLKYVCPKNTETIEDKIKIVAESRDINYVYPKEAIRNPLIWTALMWGNKRDLQLMRRLSQENSLKKASNSSVTQFVKARRAIYKISDRSDIDLPEIVGRRFLDENSFPQNTFLTLNADSLKKNDDQRLCKELMLKYFELPQMIIKLGWQTGVKRFRAVNVKSKDGKGVLCSDSYVTVHSEDKALLESACLSYNSKLAVYFLMLSSGRFTYRQVVNAREVLDIPIADIHPNQRKKITDFEAVDEKVYELFRLKDSEKILIEDLFKYTLPDFIGNSDSDGRQKTERDNEPDLTAYCDIFRRVIKAGFGVETTVFATIFQEKSETNLSPVRMVKIDLDVLPLDENKIELTSYEVLWERLKSLNKIFNQRVYKGYEPKQEGVGITVYFVKPDQKRYWLRSQAYRDADEVCAEIVASVNKSYLQKLPELKKEKKVA
jgi:type I restriction-modification system DNA methylase subunit